MNLLFASANKNKIKEITPLLSDRYKLSGLEEAGILEEIPEPGTTIKENSFLKAKYVIDRLKSEGKEAAVFADDSGLEVEALNNAPGVYSARYAGVPKNDEANNKKLLQELSSKESRRARFVTVITLLKNGQEHFFAGEVKGTIAMSPRGHNGFGYDPLFIPDGFDKTFAEFSAEEKNQISHRALAVKKLIEYLNTL
ncbi:non-canonical purine NTP pyrophosphatase, RdgB/HAM1 family [Sphingobacteriaceae bacterium]|nr:non-canonical purine NTP pyrophosphatase, RdgB/HAM1 family [Sphingobacteriaceae bacterium]